ncbi:hypothetical protein PIB30_059695 [Stylosanthes scabra]|uniref:Uncharacterized protein n=1 Tax=Stylosanthes scabra TaxID=79078 RepID=A0ABU6SKR9_9FABA|nr:hypothetical protein [Stylosanthes scabra]
MENFPHINLVIHHRGRIEKGADGLLSYVDSESGLMWTRLRGMGLEDGLRILKFYRDVVNMYEAARVNRNEIHLFIEHPISVPCLAAEGDVVASASNVGQNITPTRGKTKVRVRKTPTPKKSHGPKRALLRGEGTNKEGDSSAANFMTPTIAAFIIPEATNQLHENPIMEPNEINPATQPLQTPTQSPEQHELNLTEAISAESAVPMTNLAPSNSSDVRIGVDSSVPQGLNQRSSEFIPHAQSVDISSDELLMQYVPFHNHQQIHIPHHRQLQSMNPSMKTPIPKKMYMAQRRKRRRDHPKGHHSLGKLLCQIRIHLSPHRCMFRLMWKTILMRMRVTIAMNPRSYEVLQAMMIINLRCSPKGIQMPM